jgi:hypothetical protein
MTLSNARTLKRLHEIKSPPQLAPAPCQKSNNDEYPATRKFARAFDVTVALGARVDDGSAQSMCTVANLNRLDHKNSYVKIGLDALRGGIRSFAAEQSLATPSSSTSSRTNPKLTRKVRALTLEA